MSQRTQRTFYTAIIESILTSCIMVWYGNSTAADQTPTESGENSREDRPGAAALSAGHLPPQTPQESLQHHQSPSSHPQHTLFTLLPSGRRNRNHTGCPPQHRDPQQTKAQAEDVLEYPLMSLVTQATFNGQSKYLSVTKTLDSVHCCLAVNDDENRFYRSRVKQSQQRGPDSPLPSHFQPAPPGGSWRGVPKTVERYNPPSSVSWVCPGVSSRMDMP
ncbi:hypothetical protein L3Q82_000350 [Scortum barcoo]|uniref:Uncharacterized protein n=1 Tax=Scortum barcoo TaxID=214431 RepID=A0ACB8X9X2_9TELE|nr:hypothetical protein L3Q82_000350 [Scortum barcoo]